MHLVSQVRDVMDSYFSSDRINLIDSYTEEVFVNNLGWSHTVLTISRLVDKTGSLIYITVFFNIELKIKGKSFHKTESPDVNLNLKVMDIKENKKFFNFCKQEARNEQPLR